ncbi:hypothetical protein AB0K02_27690 [Streptomyces sp. NPDC049597]|uniref:hypothetical protein n=1 Tax=Streptomyces sp. NPDC049597 TaxID=3155276 RepID=UPI00342B0F0E
MATVAAATSAVMLPATQASAFEAVEAFSVCYKVTDCNMGYTSGSIEWETGTLPNMSGASESNVRGKVVNRIGTDYSTTAYFEFYDGDSVKRYSTTRTSWDGELSFNFMVNTEYHWRMKITVCQNWADGTRSCGSPENYSYQ